MDEIHIGDLLTTEDVKAVGIKKDQVNTACKPEMLEDERRLH